MGNRFIGTLVLALFLPGVADGQSEESTSQERIEFLVKKLNDKSEGVRSVWCTVEGTITFSEGSHLRGKQIGESVETEDGHSFPFKGEYLIDFDGQQLQIDSLQMGGYQGIFPKDRDEEITVDEWHHFWIYENEELFRHDKSQTKFRKQGRVSVANPEIMPVKLGDRFEDGPLAINALTPLVAVGHVPVCFRISSAEAFDSPSVDQFESAEVRQDKGRDYQVLICRESKNFKMIREYWIDPKLDYSVARVIIRYAVNDKIYCSADIQYEKDDERFRPISSKTFVDTYGDYEFEVTNFEVNADYHQKRRDFDPTATTEW